MPKDAFDYYQAKQEREAVQRAYDPEALRNTPPKAYVFVDPKLLWTTQQPNEYRGASQKGAKRGIEHLGARYFLNSPIRVCPLTVDDVTKLLVMDGQSTLRFAQLYPEFRRKPLPAAFYQPADIVGKCSSFDSLEALKSDLIDSADTVKNLFNARMTDQVDMDGRPKTYEPQVIYGLKEVSPYTPDFGQLVNNIPGITPLTKETLFQWLAEVEPYAVTTVKFPYNQDWSR